jgi:hypothetical protein
MRMGKIDQLRLVVSRKDMQLKTGLCAQARSDDFAPNPGENTRRHFAFVAGYKPAQNRSFARGPERRRESFECARFAVLLHLRNGTTDLRTPHEKIVQRIVDLIDLATEIFEPFTGFSHECAVFWLLSTRLCVPRP